MTGVSIKMYVIGITSPEEVREYNLKIARGEIERCKHTPKIWFESLDALLKYHHLIERDSDEKE